jgi:hypothetical protein
MLSWLRLFIWVILSFTITLVQQFIHFLTQDFLLLRILRLDSHFHTDFFNLCVSGLFIITRVSLFGLWVWGVSVLRARRSPVHFMLSMRKKASVSILALTLFLEIFAHFEFQTYWHYWRSSTWSCLRSQTLSALLNFLQFKWFHCKLALTRFFFCEALMTRTWEFFKTVFIFGSPLLSLTMSLFFESWFPIRLIHINF